MFKLPDPPLDPAQWADNWRSGPRMYSLKADNSTRQTEALAGLMVERFAFADRLSQGFVVEVHALALDAKQPIQKLIGQPLRLETRLTDGSIHTRSAMVSQVQRLRSDGGLTRFRILLEPWTFRLRLSKRSRVWQNKTVIEIIDDVLTAYQPHASWRWGEDKEIIQDHIAKAPNAGVHVYCTQYRESDFEFMQRLLAEAGLCWRVATLTDDNLPAGAFSSVLVITANTEFTPEDTTSAASAGIRFHRQGETETQDTIQAMAAVRRLTPINTTNLAWDYRSKKAVAGSAFSSVKATSEDFASSNGAWLEIYSVVPSSSDGEPWTREALSHLTTMQQDALDARSKRWLGLGNVRTLTAGRWFALTQFDQAGTEPGLSDEAPDERRRFVTINTLGLGINNLPSNANSDAPPGQDRTQPFSHPLLHAVNNDATLREVAQQGGHANRFEAVRRHIPWRPMARPHPKIRGMQTAIVVGPGGALSPEGDREVYTDSLGRVKVRFHWQSGTLADDREDNRSSCWVRVLRRSAGPGMGVHRLPRIGDEVLVTFVHGKADMPIVIGSLYSGQGEAGIAPTPGGKPHEADLEALKGSHDHLPSGQGNLRYRGRSPAWHGGAAGIASPDSAAQNNAAALSGVKSKEWGGQGFNQLVWDDTPQQLRTQLATTQHGTQLNMGHLIHQADNHRGSFRGLGFELRTDAFGSIRAQRGLLLTTYSLQLKDGVPASPAFDNAPGMALIRQACQQAKVFNQAAQTHHTTGLASIQGSHQANASAINDSASPLEALEISLGGMASAKSLGLAKADAVQKLTVPTEHNLPHTTDPTLAISAKAGYALLAGQSQHWASTDTLSQQAGQDLHLASGGQMRVHSAQSIGILAGTMHPGQTSAAGSGISLINDKGPITAQAQAGEMRIASKHKLTLQSATQHIDIAAAKRITLTVGGGAQIVIDSSGVRSRCTGTITIHAAQRSFVGPAKADSALPTRPHSVVCESCMEQARQQASALAPRA